MLAAAAASGVYPAGDAAGCGDVVVAAAVYVVGPALLDRPGKPKLHITLLGEKKAVSTCEHIMLKALQRDKSSLKKLAVVFHIKKQTGNDMFSLPCTMNSCAN